MADYIVILHPSPVRDLKGNPMKIRMRDSELVEAAWLKFAIIPPLTDVEAIRAVQKLWRACFGGVSPEVTTGRGTYVDMDNASVVVQVSAGWQALLKRLAQEFEQYEKVKWKRATADQLELKFVYEAFKRGWMRGTLLPPEERQLSKEEKQQKAYDAIMRRIAAWTAKRDRAARAIAKLNKKRKYYERAANVRVAN